MPPEPESTNLTDRQLSRLEELIGNVVSSRADFFKNLTDPRRDVDKECGYPTTVTSDMYKDMYDRNPVAARVVEVMPKECWQTQPTVYEDEDSDNVTEFEQAWDGLAASMAPDTAELGLEEDLYKDEKGSALWEYLQRLDILSGIGSYGVMLMGFSDGSRLDKPIRPRKGLKLLFCRVFPQHLAQVTSFENDPNSPRFGQPKTYLLTMNDPRDSDMGGIGLTTSTMTVHWSRVIHAAEGVQSTEWSGVPRMKGTYNQLLDIKKVGAAAPEGYWRTCFTGLSIESNPQLGAEAKMNPEKLKDMMEAYGNGFQKYLALTGMSAKTLAPSVVDPTPFIEYLITLVCVRLGIPVRVFKGSERGELASSQDDSAWNDRVGARRVNYISPKVIAPFVNRLIALGVLPKPKSFSIGWPDLKAASDGEKATVAKDKTAALFQYVSGGLDKIVAPHDYLCRFMGYSEEEATAILDAAMAHVEEQAAQTPDPEPAPMGPPALPGITKPGLKPVKPAVPFNPGKLLPGKKPGQPAVPPPTPMIQKPAPLVVKAKRR